MKYLILILLSTSLHAQTVSQIRTDLIKKSEARLAKLKKRKFNKREVKAQEAFLNCLNVSYKKNALLKCIDDNEKRLKEIKKARLRALDAMSYAASVVLARFTDS